MALNDLVSAQDKRGLWLKGPRATVLLYYSVVVRLIVTVLQYYDVVVRPRATVL